MQVQPAERKIMITNYQNKNITAIRRGIRSRLEATHECGCKKCGRLLGKLIPPILDRKSIEIKCAYCNAMNEF